MQTRLIETENGKYTVYINQVNVNEPYTIYLHGGPGFNCYAERHELGPYLNKKLNFIWFDHLGCAESPVISSDRLSHSNQMSDIITVVKQITNRPVNVIGHCLGAQLTHDLIRLEKKFVNKVV